MSTMMGYRRPTKVAALQGNVGSSRGYDLDLYGDGGGGGPMPKGMATEGEVPMSKGVVEEREVALVGNEEEDP
ncbi:Hypothetical predicted protein [Olea europaea subsp. europaea]|uniref:Uncharacterized protein n=1 Tax=Olea europaea subsp. europaea TaxID=158383 RepID=A0A8S0S6I4_OLEEU|nr:Hypothetical predicted protein [Olea europaea subsp. europaea]